MPTSRATTNPSFDFSMIFAIVCLVVALALAIKIFYNPVKQELKYAIGNDVLGVSGDLSDTPVSTDFGIVINKIGANAEAIPDVDPFNSAIYQVALTRGVAHAKGTGKPGEGKNIFLFAHSSGDLITANRFNSVFYLLHHLEVGDPIILWYQGHDLAYQVTTKNIVSPKDLNILTAPSTGEQVTLMTCWPPGTTISRLVVTAKLVE